MEISNARIENIKLSYLIYHIEKQLQTVVASFTIGNWDGTLRQAPNTFRWKKM